MAQPVAFALLGAVTFSILIAPILARVSSRKGVKEMATSFLCPLRSSGRSWQHDAEAHAAGRTGSKESQADRLQRDADSLRLWVKLPVTAVTVDRTCRLSSSVSDIPSRDR